MRMALIGLGGIGSVHLGVYESLEDIEIAAVVDIDVEKVSEKLKGKNIKLYKNIDAMLDSEKIDFVDICTPTYLHEDHAIKVMSRGINVLCEKPISLTKKSADRMVEAAKTNNVIFMIAHVIRFWPQYVYLKQVCDEKTFGKLFNVSFSRIGALPKWSYNDWWLDINKSGRAPIDLHIHDVDFALYMLGKPNYIFGKSIEEQEKITYITACYEYDNCLINLEGGMFGSPLPFSASYRAVFERAILEYKDNKLMVYENNKEVIEIKFDDKKNAGSGINVSSANGYENEIKYFINCIKDGKSPEITTPESSAESLGIVEKTLESARLGQKVGI